MSKRGAVVLLSGGLDSSTLLHQVIYEDFAPHVLIVNYGQRHTREIRAAYEVARAVSDRAAVEIIQVNLADAMIPIFGLAASSQVGAKQDVPHGHYAAENMKTTIVPNRNMLLLALAGCHAVAIGVDTVAYAAHAGDHAIYPDCRPVFVADMNAALSSATDGAIRLHAPFLTITKTDIVNRGKQLGVPFGLTYSCYEGREIHCGLCGTCVERKEAFRDSGVPDPTVYAA
jgi:7-cyano-7-deazaguanine synthase